MLAARPQALRKAALPAHTIFLNSTPALRAAATKAAAKRAVRPVNLPEAGGRNNRPVNVPGSRLGDLRIIYGEGPSTELYAPRIITKPKSVVTPKVARPKTFKTHLSLEGGQCGALTLEQCLQLIQKCDGGGFQPGIYALMKDADQWTFHSPQYVRDMFEKYGLQLDVASFHCPVWAEGMASTFASGMVQDLRPTRPFLPSHLHNASANEIVRFTRAGIARGMELMAALNHRILPMFMANYAGPHVGTKYPWGFFKGPNYDLLMEGDERFVAQTKWIRSLAASFDQVLAQEIHPNCMADSGHEFMRLLKVLDNDKTWRVWGDPSHCWDWEHWLERLERVAPYMVGSHIKNFVRGAANGGRQYDWLLRFHRFADFLPGVGEVDMVAYVQMLWKFGVIQRFCQLQRTDSCALSGEVEAPNKDYSKAVEQWFDYGRTMDLLHVPTGSSLEDGMAAEKKKKKV